MASLECLTDEDYTTLFEIYNCIFFHKKTSSSSKQTISSCSLGTITLFHNDALVLNLIWLDTVVRVPLLQWIHDRNGLRLWSFRSRDLRAFQVLNKRALSTASKVRILNHGRRLRSSYDLAVINTELVWLHLSTLADKR